MKSSTECEDTEMPSSGFLSLGAEKVGRRSKARRSSSESLQERYFTVEEVAESLNVSTRTVRRWIDRKKLIAHDFEGIIRISESDLRVFIARHRRS